MPATWSFNPSYPSDVDMEVTQMEQFDNDNIDIGSSLVREVIQNSMDAHKNTERVEVHFSIRDVTDARNYKVNLLHENLKPIEQHLVACGKSIPDDNPVRMLCIEDYNTTGLTGSIDKKDDKNFSKFWRASGTSEKKGKAGGRRGLGKVVFAASSKTRTFFGVTRRQGDDELLAMGQVILKTHSIGKRKYKPHGFWHEDCRTNTEDLQLPTSDEAEIDNLRYISGFKRTAESGLSIIIPYPRDNIKERNLIDNVLENYYFSILSNQLVVKVNKTVISVDTFENVYKKSTRTKSSIPLDFVSSVSSLLRFNQAPVRANTVDLKKFPKNLFSKSQIEKMRESYKSNEIIHVVVPIMLREKGQNFDYKGEYNLFLRSLKKNETAFNFFARGPILLPGERRQYGVNCHAGFIAQTGKIADSFLGDAENASHTKWDASADLLQDRWQDYREPLRVMRNSLGELFNLVAKQEESKDNDVLGKFFSIPRDRSRTGSEPPNDEQGIAENQYPSSSSPNLGFEILKHESGFTLVPQEANHPEKKLQVIRVEMAYNRVGGNALGHYNKLDFDLNDPSTIQAVCLNGEVEIIESNVLDIHPKHPEFSVNVTLADTYRDLFVRASVLE